MSDFSISGARPDLNACAQRIHANKNIYFRKQDENREEFIYQDSRNTSGSIAYRKDGTVSGIIFRNENFRGNPNITQYTQYVDIDGDGKADSQLVSDEVHVHDNDILSRLKFEELQLRRQKGIKVTTEFDSIHGVTTELYTDKDGKVVHHVMKGKYGSSNSVWYTKNVTMCYQDFEGDGICDMYIKTEDRTYKF